MNNLQRITISTAFILLIAMSSPATPGGADERLTAPQTPQEKKIGLALGGGGAKGLCHIAFLKALDEMDLKPSVIAGTSIGAVVGGFYAAGVSGIQIEQILKKMGFLDTVEIIDFSIPSDSGVVTGKGIETFLSKHIPARTFEELEIPLKVVATDFWGRKQVIFQHGNLIQAIRASMSMPALFEPVKLGSMVLVDGGAANPLPYDIIRKECDILIAIDVSGEKAPPAGYPIPSMFESIVTTFQIMGESIIRNKMKIVKPDIYIKPNLTNIRAFEFHRYAEIMESVKEDVELLKRKLYEELSQSGKGRMYRLPSGTTRGRMQIETTHGASTPAGAQ
jgi:NTE family protein